MKETLNTYEIADRLFRDENASFSYAGAHALAEYLEQLEEDTGEEMEFDRVAIRCDYSEHSSLVDWAGDYFSGDWKESLSIEPEDSEDENDEAIRDYIRDHGTLIEFDGGIIVSSF
jgi:hypothetical protein